MIKALFYSLFVVGACGAPALAAALAAAPAGHEHHREAAGTVGHTHATAAAGGLKASFHFNAAQDGKLTCSMHPEVVSDKPGTCPQCKMDLVKRTHAIGFALEGTKAKQPPAGAKVQLQIADAHGMVQTLPAGHFTGQFHLMPGKYTASATVTPKGGKPLVFKVPYEVK